METYQENHGSQCDPCLIPSGILYRSKEIKIKAQEWNPESANYKQEVEQIKDR